MGLCLLHGFCCSRHLGIPGLRDHYRPLWPRDPCLPKATLLFMPPHLRGEVRPHHRADTSLWPKEQGEVCPPWDLVPFSAAAGLGAGRRRTSSLEAGRVQTFTLQSLINGVPLGHWCWTCAGRAQWQRAEGPTERPRPSTSPSGSRLSRLVGHVVCGKCAAHPALGFPVFATKSAFGSRWGGRAPWPLLPPPFLVPPPQLPGPSCCLGL